MKKLEIEDLDIQVTSEELKKITYNIFAVIVMLMPVVPEIMHFGIYSFKWMMYVGITIITSIILLGIAIKERTFKLTFLDATLGIYLLLVAISTVLTKYGVFNAILGENGRGEGLLLIFCYSLTFIIFSKGYKYIKWTLKIGIIAAGVVTVYCMLQALLPVNIELPFGAKRIENVATGTMPNQNFLSSYICIFLPMIAFNYINTGKKTSLCLAIMLFLAQVFSVTLGGYITFIAIFLIVVIYSLIVSNEKTKVILNTIVLTILMVLSFVFVNNINDSKYSNELRGIKKETINLANKSNRFGTNRLGIWKKTIMAINNHKWFGVGPDCLWEEISKEEYLLEKPKDAYYKKILDKAHSEPLHIAATTGIPSMVAYLIFVTTICLLLIKICITGLQNRKEKIQDENNLYMHMVLISILSYLMQSMINISMVQVAPIYWSMLGLGAGVIYNENAQKNN